jgi:hypothetical protein
MHTKAVWLQQACRRPEDRERVFSALMKPAGKTEGENMASKDNHGRASLKPMFDEAVAALTEAFGAEQPSNDPKMAVWIAFPKLDRERRIQLAELLLKERQYHAELS